MAIRPTIRDKRNTPELETMHGMDASMCGTCDCPNMGGEEYCRCSKIIEEKHEDQVVVCKID